MGLPGALGPLGASVFRTGAWPSSLPRREGVPPARVSARDGAKLVAVDLGPAKTLTLQVDFGSGGDDSGDHFDWGWAAVIAQ